MSKDSKNSFLIVAACSETRALEVIDDLRKQGHRKNFTVLIANIDPEKSPLSQFSTVILCNGSSVELFDFENLGSVKFNQSLLIINHVIRPSYKALVEATVSFAEESFLYTFNGGFQSLDIRDSFDSLKSINSEYAEVSKHDSKLCLMFRPSDQTMKRFEKERLEGGLQVLKVDSIFEFEQHLPQTSEVFFNWCITDYVALKQAFDLSLIYPVKRTGYITVDLVDLAEDEELKEELLTLNQSMISQLDFAYVMSTRQFFIERYKLDSSKLELSQTTTNNSFESQFPVKSKSQRTLKLFYHGMMYYWHELDQFMPIFEELNKICDMELVICGRVHESVKYQGKDLFPLKEKQMREALVKYQEFKNVRYLGFAPMKDLRREMDRSHYFIGLTAGVDLMAQSEFRTGVIEALQNSGLTLLHKKTPALDYIGLKDGDDYLAIDANDTPKSAQIIVSHFNKMVKENA